jgi:hypothetical protein
VFDATAAPAATATVTTIPLMMPTRNFMMLPFLGDPC